MMHLYTVIGFIAYLLVGYIIKLLADRYDYKKFGITYIGNNDWLVIGWTFIIFTLPALWIYLLLEKIEESKVFIKIRSWIRGY
jgi:hypothetical protein